MDKHFVEEFSYLITDYSVYRISVDINPIKIHLQVLTGTQEYDEKKFWEGKSYTMITT